MRVQHGLAAVTAVGRDDRETAGQGRGQHRAEDGAVARVQDPVEPAAALERESSVPVGWYSQLDADPELLAIGAFAR